MAELLASGGGGAANATVSDALESAAATAADEKQRSESSASSSAASPMAVEDNDAENEEASEFTCEECGDTFDSQNSLDEHELYHRAATPFSCPICKTGYLAPCNSAIFF